MRYRNNAAMEPGIVRGVHHSHPAVAEWLEHDVTTQHVARPQLLVPAAVASFGLERLRLQRQARVTGMGLRYLGQQLAAIRAGVQVALDVAALRSREQPKRQIEQLSLVRAPRRERL